ncbi:uncharacterized protein E0L32_008751 [Thyridium curvatum]|uniref:Uncharacterized protein n=1 Tax=Thyridium curvatum TaxID=1093900 RepID=A0A507AUF5_9PEZI|nr:uncharacterized protein E0L32_008751 [Thyridium curvatum]TPX10346.1 hypothetical protein E0L32_008751 [Thyridium curvatum]
MASVPDLVSQMHDTLTTIHSTLASLSTTSHAERLDALEHQREQALSSLSSTFEAENDDLAHKRRATRQEIAERRRREDEEREAARRREDAELENQELGEDTERRKKFDNERTGLEEEVEKEMEGVEREAGAMLEEGRRTLEALEEKRRELNRLIDEQLKMPLPAAPTRRRGRSSLDQTPLNQAVAANSKPPESIADITDRNVSSNTPLKAREADTGSATASEPVRDVDIGGIRALDKPETETEVTQGHDDSAGDPPSSPKSRPSSLLGKMGNAVLSLVGSSDNDEEKRRSGSPEGYRPEWSAPGGYPLSDVQSPLENTQVNSPVAETDHGQHVPDPEPDLVSMAKQVPLPEDRDAQSADDIQQDTVTPAGDPHLDVVDRNHNLEMLDAGSAPEEMDTSAVGKLHQDQDVVPEAQLDLSGKEPIKGTMTHGMDEPERLVLLRSESDIRARESDTDGQQMDADATVQAETEHVIEETPDSEVGQGSHQEGVVGSSEEPGSALLSADKLEVAEQIASHTDHPFREDDDGGAVPSSEVVHEDIVDQSSDTSTAVDEHGPNDNAYQESVEHGSEGAADEKLYHSDASSPVRTPRSAVGHHELDGTTVEEVIDADRALSPVPGQSKLGHMEQEKKNFALPEPASIHVNGETGVDYWDEKATAPQIEYVPGGGATSENDPEHSQDSTTAHEPRACGDVPVYEDRGAIDESADGPTSLVEQLPVSDRSSASEMLEETGTNQSRLISDETETESSTPMASSSLTEKESDMFVTPLESAVTEFPSNPDLATVELDQHRVDLANKPLKRSGADQGELQHPSTDIGDGSNGIESESAATVQGQEHLFDLDDEEEDDQGSDVEYGDRASDSETVETLPRERESDRHLDNGHHTSATSLEGIPDNSSAEEKTKPFLGGAKEETAAKAAIDSSQTFCAPLQFQEMSLPHDERRETDKRFVVDKSSPEDNATGTSQGNDERVNTGLQPSPLSRDEMKSPVKGLADSRHAPARPAPPLTPPRQTPKRERQDSDASLFTPRDVTNIPWHSRNEMTPVSLHDRTLSSASTSEPLYDPPLGGNYDSDIRETGDSASVAHGRNSQGRTAMLAKWQERESSPAITPPPQPASNRSSVASAASSNLFQKMRNIFEQPQGSSTPVGSRHNSVGDGGSPTLTRPASGTWLRRQEATAASEKQRLLGEDEDEQHQRRVDERSALLSSY